MKRQSSRLCTLVADALSDQLFCNVRIGYTCVPKDVLCGPKRQWTKPMLCKDQKKWKCDERKRCCWHTHCCESGLSPEEAFKACRRVKVENWFIVEELGDDH